MSVPGRRSEVAKSAYRSQASDVEVGSCLPMKQMPLFIKVSCSVWEAVLVNCCYLNL